VRRNPIPPRDPKFLLDPRPWTDGTVLEYSDTDDAGFFHVTTSRDRVFEDGRLRSRQDVKAIGLGGGHVDKGHHVSFVTDWNRAMWLYESMKQLREQLEPDGSAAAVLKLILEWTGYPNDPVWPDDDERLDMYAQRLAAGSGAAALGTVLASRKQWLTAIKRNAKQIEKKWPTPEARYEMVIWAEETMAFLLPSPDERLCVPLVGFTAPFARYMQIDPAQMSVVQAAVREGAKVADIIPDECELRFAPKDIQLVAIDCQVRANCLAV
jgi:hypothetical protein